MRVVASSSICHEMTQSAQSRCFQTVDTLLLHFLVLQDYVVQHWSGNRVSLARELGTFEMWHVQYISWTDSVKSLLFSKCGCFISKGSPFQIILFVMVISPSKKMPVTFFQISYIYNIFGTTKTQMIIIYGCFIRLRLCMVTQDLLFKDKMISYTKLVSNLT